MNLSTVIGSISNMLNTTMSWLAPIPGMLLVCTSCRRPGFSSLVTSAAIYADMEGITNEEFDDVVKKFVYNVVDKIKRNIQDDGVCFVAIPPGEMKFTLIGGNEGGPIVLNESPEDSKKLASNNTYIFAWAIIR